MSLRVNPEYEKLLPKMSGEEFAELKASIQAEGKHYPIVANEDLEILDGYHRFKACVELGIEPDFEVRKFEDKLLEKELFCPSCGHAMFECSKCHTTLQDSLQLDREDKSS